MVKPISKVLLLIFQVHLHLIAVNEEVDEDEGYDSIASKNSSVAYNSGMKNVIHLLDLTFVTFISFKTSSEKKENSPRRLKYSRGRFQRNSHRKVPTPQRCIWWVERRENKFRIWGGFSQGLHGRDGGRGTIYFVQLNFNSKAFLDAATEKRAFKH